MSKKGKFMFLKKQIQHSLIAISGIALIGCSSPKTITIKPHSQRPIIAGARTIPHQAPIIIQEERRPIYREEIETRVEIPKDIVPPRRVEPKKEPKKKEPRVVVPLNNPVLDIKRGSKESDRPIIKDVDRLNGEKMERMPFPLDEYRHLKKIGRSTVSGKVAIINTMSEKEVLGKNLKLYLNPVTTYSSQWYNESYLGGYKMSKVDKRLYNYLKFSTSNDNGKFDFFGVAKGKYYLIGSMMCGEECGLGSPEKIRLVKEVYVGSGVTKVDLIKRVP